MKKESDYLDIKQKILQKYYFILRIIFEPKRPHMLHLTHYNYSQIGYKNIEKETITSFMTNSLTLK